MSHYFLGCLLSRCPSSFGSLNRCLALLPTQSALTLVPILINIPEHLKRVQQLVFFFVVLSRLSYLFLFAAIHAILNIWQCHGAAHRIRIFLHISRQSCARGDALILGCGHVLDELLVYQPAVSLVDQLHQLRHREEARVHSVLATQLVHPVLLKIPLIYRHAFPK